MLKFGSRSRLRQAGPLLDKINIVMAVGVLVSAVFLIVDRQKYQLAFPILFTFAALMNLFMAIKCYKMAEMGRMIIQAIATVALVALSIIGYIVIL